MFAKRRKLEETTAREPETTFLSLNDDCLYKIFEWLELDDLCSINETCKDLQALASDYFQRKHPDKLSTGMQIMVIKEKIKLQPDAKYVKSFSRCFDSVIIGADSRADSACLHNVYASTQMLALFIQANCNEHLSSIQFRSMVLQKSFGIHIRNVLINVESIVFSACHMEDSYHESILKHCQRLKYLTVGGDYGNKIDELLLETYTTLEQFQCRYYGRLLMTNNLKIFLKQNPNLKRLTWCFHARIREATFRDKTVECIQTIVENGKNLEELFLSFDGTYDLVTICEKLKVLCNRKHFKRLDLDFRFTTLGYKVSKMMIEQGDQLAKLKSLYGLYLFDFSDYGNTILPTLSSLKNLRVLQIDCVVSVKRFANLSLGDLTSLEELHIISLENVKFAQLFICQVVKLNKIFIVNCKFNVAKLDFPMLNEQRRNLSDGACELTIYAGESQRRANCNFNEALVKIEYVNFKIDAYNTSNPFIQRAHLNKKRL